MPPTSQTAPRGLGVAATVILFATGAPSSAIAQTGTARGDTSDSAAVRASTAYAAGTLRRRLLGDGYRDLWAIPIKVPVLELRTFGGGLHPLKLGGGNETKSLRFTSARGLEFVFRPVYKQRLANLGALEGTLVGDLFLDALSAAPPAAPLLAGPFLDAAGVLHPHPILVVMPNDSTLAQYRERFGGVLGTIEEYPMVPDEGPGFARATRIIDSQELLERLDRDPREQIDARAFLRARLVDLLLGDNDRHPGQWKWARVASDSGSPWIPIARDRDEVFVSHDGLLLGPARFVWPNLVSFRQMSGTALFENAMEFDRRLLGGLDRARWDSTAADLVRAISDSIIDAAMHAMPPEYYSALRGVAARVQWRRLRLPAAADQYYRSLFAVADVHATDADDRATIVRSSDGGVEVRIRSGGNPPYFVRRFDGHDTREVRLYLHDGNDGAVVTGAAARSIVVRIVGGNGTNALVDSSSVGGRRAPTRMYDRGSVKGVTYPSDSSNSDNTWNRRPFLSAYGGWVTPAKDRGTILKPALGMETDNGLGFAPRIGVRRYRYGFRAVPYASMIGLQAAYSTRLGGWELELLTDERSEESPLHVASETRWSEIAVTDFHGLGNNAPWLPGAVARPRQQQAMFHPTLGLALGPRSDLSLGPIVKYTSTGTEPGSFVAGVQPYGFAHFGQAGMQLDFQYDTRDRDQLADRSTPAAPAQAPAVNGLVTRLTATAYPALWDAHHAFSKVAGEQIMYLSLPVLTGPVLALRAGGEKVFGQFPYFESAFLGGLQSLRTLPRQRFAGDASLYGSAELRLPIARFPFILPLNTGVIGLVDAGRVYVDGESPGGWHTGVAAGLWLGAFSPGSHVHILWTNNRERRVRVGLGFDF